MIQGCQQLQKPDIGLGEMTCVCADLKTERVEDGSWLQLRIHIRRRRL